MISPEGIELYGLRYRGDELAPYVNPEIKRIVRIDPRDISVISMESPIGGHIQVPWVDRGRPRLSYGSGVRSAVVIDDAARALIPKSSAAVWKRTTE